MFDFSDNSLIVIPFLILSSFINLQQVREILESSIIFNTFTVFIQKTSFHLILRGEFWKIIEKNKRKCVYLHLLLRICSITSTYFDCSDFFKIFASFMVSSIKAMARFTLKSLLTLMTAGVEAYFFLLDSSLTGIGESLYFIGSNFK